MSWKLPVIGVSLLVVAVLTAGAGSAQASNTTICTMSNLSQICTTPRLSGTVYEAAASGTNAVQTSSGESLSCTGSVIEFKTKATVGSPLLPAEVPHWTLTGCIDTMRGVSCVARFEARPYKMTIADTGSDNGFLKVTAGPSGINPILEYECASTPVIICAFETPEIKIETSGGSTPAVANMSAFMEKKSGSASCGKESKLFGKYLFTAPSSSFFVEHD
jgi:hypothetical protein